MMSGSRSAAEARTSRAANELPRSVHNVCAVRADERQFLDRAGREQLWRSSSSWAGRQPSTPALRQLVERCHRPADLEFDIADGPAGRDRNLGLALLLQPGRKPKHRPRRDQNAQHSREQLVVLETSHPVPSPAVGRSCPSRVKVGLSIRTVGRRPSGHRLPSWLAKDEATEPLTRPGRVTFSVALARSTSSAMKRGNAKAALCTSGVQYLVVKLPALR